MAHRTYDTIGNSGWPWISPNSPIKVNLQFTHPIAIGTLVIFDHQGILIGHRVIKSKKTHTNYSYLIKGDNSLYTDGWIDASHIIATAPSSLSPWVKKLLHPLWAFYGYFQTRLYDLIVTSFFGKVIKYTAHRMGLPPGQMSRFFKWIFKPWTLLTPRS